MWYSNATQRRNAEQNDIQQISIKSILLCDNEPYLFYKTFFSVIINYYLLYFYSLALFACVRLKSTRWSPVLAPLFSLARKH